jgi:hypothetical protein
LSATEASSSSTRELNDQQLNKLVCGLPVQFELWLSSKLVLRTMRVRYTGRGFRVDVRDEVLLEVANG